MFVPKAPSGQSPSTAVLQKHSIFIAIHTMSNRPPLIIVPLPPGIFPPIDPQLFRFTGGGWATPTVHSVLHFESCRRAKITVPLDMLPQLDGRLQSQIPGTTLHALPVLPESAFQKLRELGQEIKNHITENLHPGSRSEWRAGKYKVVREPGQQGVFTFEIARGVNGFGSQEYMGVTLATVRDLGARTLLKFKAEHVFEGDRVSAGSETPRQQDSSAPEDRPSPEDEQDFVVV
jgi:hypothetical protein